MTADPLHQIAKSLKHTPARFAPTWGAVVAVVPCAKCSGRVVLAEVRRNETGDYLLCNDELWAKLVVKTNGRVGPSKRDMRAVVPLQALLDGSVREFPIPCRRHGRRMVSTEVLIAELKLATPDEPATVAA